MTKKTRAIAIIKYPNLSNELITAVHSKAFKQFEEDGGVIQNYSRANDDCGMPWEGPGAIINWKRTIWVFYYGKHPLGVYGLRPDTYEEEKIYDKVAYRVMSKDGMGVDYWEVRGGWQMMFNKWVSEYRIQQ